MIEYRDIRLGRFNSFGVDAVADRLVEAGSAAELRALFRAGLSPESRWDVLGGGNNILFAGDYPGTLVRPTIGGVEATGAVGGAVRVRAGAGVEWDAFVAWTVGQGLWGAENLSLIPGTVGAAPVQNVGAYGAEAKDIVESVELYYPHKDTMATLEAAGCGFGYRDSIFKRELRGRAIITSVVFRLSRVPSPRLDYGLLGQRVAEAGGPSLANIRGAVIAIRESKLPDPKVTGNAGSFFKNPSVTPDVAARLKADHPDMPVYPSADGGVKLAAGWLIERAGWRGRREGRVGVHPGQALVLINTGGATGAEVLRLADRVAGDVKDKFGVELEPEINILP